MTPSIRDTWTFGLLKTNRMFLGVLPNEAWLYMGLRKISCISADCAGGWGLPLVSLPGKHELPEFP